MNACRRARALKQPCRAWPTGWIDSPGFWLIAPTELAATPRRPSSTHAGPRACGQTWRTIGSRSPWSSIATVTGRASLASLDTLKAKQGEFTGSDLLLSAMNLERLNRNDEAQAAVGHAVHWMEEKSRKAGGDAFLRMEFELMRPNFEALLREAQSLMNGEPADSGRPA